MTQMSKYFLENQRHSVTSVFQLRHKQLEWVNQTCTVWSELLSWLFLVIQTHIERVILSIYLTNDLNVLGHFNE